MRHILPILAAAVLFAACDGAPFPLSSSDALPVDRALLGAWELTDADSVVHSVQIWAFNDHEYYVEYTDSDTRTRSLDEEYRLRVFLSPVDDATFANLQCVDCEDPFWLFLQIEWTSPDELVLTPVGDDLYARFKDAVGPDAVRSTLMDALPEALERGDAVWLRRIGPDEKK